MMILRNPHLLAFESICELGTTHAAARHLHLTQTAITQRIKTLEHELGLTLFLRSRRGMRPTPEAISLLQFCKASRELEGQFLAKVKGEAHREISLTILGPTSAIASRISDCVAPLYKKFPFLRLNLRSDDSSDLIEMLRRGEADFAVVDPKLVANELDSKLLRPDRYLLVASPLWRGRKLQEILERERIIDFHERDQTTLRYLAHFQLSKNSRPDRLFVNENEALVRLLKAGVGYGTLAETLAKPHLENSALITLNRSQAMEDPLALTWFPRSNRPDYFEEILKALK